MGCCPKGQKIGVLCKKLAAGGHWRVNSLAKIPLARRLGVGGRWSPPEPAGRRWLKCRKGVACFTGCPPRPSRTPNDLPPASFFFLRAWPLEAQSSSSPPRSARKSTGPAAQGLRPVQNGAPSAEVHAPLALEKEAQRPTKPSESCWFRKIEAIRTRLKPDAAGRPLKRILHSAPHRRGCSPTTSQMFGRSTDRLARRAQWFFDRAAQKGIGSSKHLCQDRAPR